MSSPDYQAEAEALREELAEVSREADRLRELINTPLFEDFLEAAKNEAAHQRERWGEDHDALKEPQDWYWTLGYLSGKALRAHLERDYAKALHHTISSAALLIHWHARVLKDRKEASDEEP